MTTVTLTEILANKPEKASSSEETKAYNAALYNIIKNGNPEDKNNAIAELTMFNENYFETLVSSSFNSWNNYSLCSREDAIGELQMAFLEVIRNSNISEWSTAIWYKTMDIAKQNIHKNFSNGGIHINFRRQLAIYNETSDAPYQMISDEFTTETEEKEDLNGDPLSLILDDERNEVISNVTGKIVTRSGLDGQSLTIIGYRLSDNPMPYKEIGNLLNISEASARKKYSRAMDYLRVCADEVVTEEEKDILFA